MAKGHPTQVAAEDKELAIRTREGGAHLARKGRIKALEQRGNRAPTSLHSAGVHRFNAIVRYLSPPRDPKARSFSSTCADEAMGIHARREQKAGPRPGRADRISVSAWGRCRGTFGRAPPPTHYIARNWK